MERFGVTTQNVSEIGQHPTTDILPRDVKLAVIARRGPIRSEDIVGISRPLCEGYRDYQILDASSVLVVQYIVAIVEQHSQEIWRCQMTPRDNYIDVNRGSHKIEANVLPSINTVITTSVQGLGADDECPSYAARITFRLPITIRVNCTLFDVTLTLKDCGQRLEPNDRGEVTCDTFEDRLHQDVARPVKKIRVTGALSTELGREIIRHFQRLVDLGDYDRIQRDRRTLTDVLNRNRRSSCWQDLVCLALLEEADACLTKRTMAEAEATANKVFGLVRRYNSVNARVIRGYAFVVRAIAARVKGQFSEAETFLQRAHEEMETVEACQFKCYAPYNVGTLAMDKLGTYGPDNVSEVERQKAQQAFRDAVGYCSIQHESHMLPRVLNRQASFLLGSTPNKVPDTSLSVPEQDITEAGEILSSLQRDVFPRFPAAEWAKTLYHLNMSDLHMRKGDIHQAIEEARICVRLATQFGGLGQKKQGAEQRIQRLQNMLQIEEAPAV